MRQQSRSTLGLALVVLGTLVGPTLGVSWVMSEGKAIAMARIDPIVNEGDVAGHVHNIIGGSKFSQFLTQPGETQQCSSLNVQADKSNYWAPQLYYRYPDNTYSPMLGSSRVYYFNNAKDVVPFPPGLRMLSGTAMSRNESDIRSAGLKISCDHGLQTSKLPTKESNPGGCSTVSTSIFFPSCGLKDMPLDSQDHFSHMMFPHSYKGSEPYIDPNGAHCPESHPVHYPVIFMEHNYWFNDDQPWRNEDNLLVLSNGDTTGLAYHADFHNGWDQTVLKDAIEQCTVGDRVADCPPFAPSVSIEKSWNCRLEGEIPSEEVGLYQSLKNLPGCNPLWTASMPDKKPTCDVAPAKPGFSAANAYFRSDWQRMNIPLTLPEATPDKLTSWYKPETFQGMTPKPGGTSGSFKVWGSEDTAKYVKVASISDLLKSFVANNGTKVEGGSAPAPSSSSAPASSLVEIGSSHLAEGSSTSSSAGSESSSGSTTVTVTHSAAAATVTVESPTCRRRSKKRKLIPRIDGMTDTIRSHIARRSRRRAVQA